MNGWPWEGTVQQVFADRLATEGWVIERLADTAKRQHGIDVLASHGSRHLGAEVKGYPSDRYTDPNKTGVKKPSTSPTKRGTGTPKGCSQPSCSEKPNPTSNRCWSCPTTLAIASS